VACRARDDLAIIRLQPCPVRDPKTRPLIAELPDGNSLSLAALP